MPSAGATSVNLPASLRYSALARSRIGDEEIEIAVGVEVDPRRLAHRAGRHREADVGGGVGELAGGVAIELEHRGIR